jgi:hypothetical protein
MISGRLPTFRARGSADSIEVSETNSLRQRTGNFKGRNREFHTHNRESQNAISAARSHGDIGVSIEVLNDCATAKAAKNKALY